MDLQASIEQVAGILVRQRLRFQTHQDGGSYRLLFDDDAVFIHFEAWDDGVRIALTSPALQEIEPDTPGHALALNQVNALNLRDPFVKWAFTGGTLVAAIDLLGDHLQAAELLNAVYALAAAADLAAGDLADPTGGRRYAEVFADELAELEVEDE